MWGEHEGVVWWFSVSQRYLFPLADISHKKNMQSLEAVQKFACKVCLKQWDLDYDNVAAVQPPLFVSLTYIL